MFGIWKVEALRDADAANFERIADVSNCMNEEIKGALYLPPYMRANQCDIQKGSKIVGYLDESTGLGAAFFGFDSADYGYFLDSDLQLKQNLSVSKDINGDGEVSAGNIKLSVHTHNATLQVSTTGSPTAQTGTATGSTQAPN